MICDPWHHKATGTFFFFFQFRCCYSGFGILILLTLVLKNPKMTSQLWEIDFFPLETHPCKLRVILYCIRWYCKIGSEIHHNAYYNGRVV